MVCVWRYCVACRKGKKVRASACLHSAKYSGFVTVVIGVDMVIGVDVANIAADVMVYSCVMRCDVADVQCSNLCGELSFVHSYFLLPFIFYPPYFPLLVYYLLVFLEMAYLKMV